MITTKALIPQIEDFLNKINQFLSEEVKLTEDFISAQNDYPEKACHLKELQDIYSKLTEIPTTLRKDRDLLLDYATNASFLQLQSHSTQEDHKQQKEILAKKQKLENDLQGQLNDCNEEYKAAEGKLEAIQISSGYQEHNPYIARITEIPKPRETTKEIEQVKPEKPEATGSFWSRWKGKKEAISGDNTSTPAPTPETHSEASNADSSKTPLKTVKELFAVESEKQEQQKNPWFSKKGKKEASIKIEVDTVATSSLPAEAIVTEAPPAEPNNADSNTPTMESTLEKIKKKWQNRKNTSAASQTGLTPETSVTEQAQCKPIQMQEQTTSSREEPEVLPLSEILSIPSDKKIFSSRPRSASVSSPSSPTHAPKEQPQATLSEISTVNSSLFQKWLAAIAEKKSVAIMTEPLEPAVKVEKAAENARKENLSLDDKINNLLKKLNTQASRKGSDAPKNLEALYIETQSEAFVNLSSQEKLERLNIWMNKHKPEKPMGWAKWLFTFQWLRKQAPENKFFFIKLRRDIDEIIAFVKKETDIPIVPNAYKLSRADSSVESFTDISTIPSSLKANEALSKEKHKYPVTSPEERQLINCVDAITTLITDWYNSFGYLKLTPPPFVDMLYQTVVEANNKELSQQAESLLNATRDMSNASFFGKPKYLLYNLEQFDNLTRERQYLQESIPTDFNTSVLKTLAK